MKYCISIETFMGRIFADLKRFADDEATISNLCVTAEISPENGQLGSAKISYEQRERTAIDAPVTAEEFNCLYRCVKNATDYQSQENSTLAKSIVNTAAHLLFLFGAYARNRHETPDDLKQALEQFCEIF